MTPFGDGSQQPLTAVGHPQVALWLVTPHMAAFREVTTPLPWGVQGVSTVHRITFRQ